MKYPLVIIDWVDSNGDGRWNPVKAAIGEDLNLNCQSVGWLIVNKKDRIIIAQSFSMDQTAVDATLTLPRVSIKRITRVKCK